MPEVVKLITPTSANPAAGESAPQPARRDQGYGAERALWTLVGVGLLWWSWRLNNFTSVAWTVPFLVLGNLWGIATVLASWLPDMALNGDGRPARAFAWGTAVVTVTLFVVWGVAVTQAASGYATDAIAFNQYAAELARHGLNPYVHSMARAYALFHIAPSGYTYSFTGAPVTALSYPSLSFLVYVPLLALGWAHNLAPLLNVCAWGLTAALMFALSPRPLRPAALLFSGFGLYAVFAVGGVTDVLFMPLLTLAAYRWDRFGASRWTYAGPLLLGLAMGIKQTAWPLLPFLLIALGLDQSRRSGPADGLGRACRYLAAVLVAFAIPNLPYFVASPHAWTRGVLTPLVHSLVPTGQGTISLSLFLHMGGGSLTAFTLATVLMFALTLVAFAGTYPRLRSGFWLLPALAFFFASRSNVNYFAALIPAGYIAATSISPAPLGRGAYRIGAVGSAAGRALGRWFLSPPWAAATAVLAAAFLAAAVYSLSAPAPLGIRLTALQTAGRSARVQRLTVRVSNRSGGALKPVFDVQRSGTNASFWSIAAGPRRLASGQAADYTLLAPNADSEPSLHGTFTVIGLVASPRSFSVSDEYDAGLYRLGTRHRQRGTHSLEIRFGGR
jgi:hypothetical protein